MVAQNPAPENFESTAQLMLVVLNKAEVELSKVIAECLEMVSVAGISFQKLLMMQLRSINNKYQTAADCQLDELYKVKEQILSIIRTPEV
jgi:hypothetical protein